MCRPVIKRRLQFYYIIMYGYFSGDTITRALRIFMKHVSFVYSFADVAVSEYNFQVSQSTESSAYK